MEADDDDDDEKEETDEGLPSLWVKVQQKDDEQDEFLMNRWKKVYALKRGRKHQSKQDTLKRQRNLICRQLTMLWNAMATIYVSVHQEGILED